MSLPTVPTGALPGQFVANAGPVHSTENPAATTGVRQTSLYNCIDGLPPVPSADDVAGSELKTDDIQSDIFVGKQKHNQLFYFFTIHDAASFKRHLAADIAPIVTSVTQIPHVHRQPLVAVNIAFSHAGLLALDVNYEDNSLNDEIFENGQAASAVTSLNDDTASWVPQFKDAENPIHGVIILASDNIQLIDRQVACIQSDCGPSISKVYSLPAAVRPGCHAGHEMFGFLDGIAQPSIRQLHKTHFPGQNVVDAGVIITGAVGDVDGEGNPIKRADWAVGGSFLAFRQLQQLVPEFNRYLLQNAPAGEGDLQSRADLMGARMVGRWKSGAPVDLAPTADDPELGADPQRNNNFTYEHEGSDLRSDQSRCPFTAHIRKTRPRADLTSIGFDDKPNSIMRAGIPYGQEVTPEEQASGTTIHERGLAFVAYQSQLAKGFQFIQQSWANATNFPPKKTPPPEEIGFDPIIGQATGAQARLVSGLDPNDTSGSLSIPQFVISRGGEYFFSPPISALRGHLAGIDDGDHEHLGRHHCH
ncbi:DyP-type peroxidase [Auricularia subglabra TFB-10046 SS5]|uniref:DyP-type peroxidase n=1 Tax=Auricularia subglabra (strain TFB-10046 / SS5) TaxID=717982 RepID=J0CZS0_AURST|nr:DyP-type peroxidase [Auricularia subglabra TFB-10046 SS5]